MTLADATPSLPDWRHYTKRLTSSRKRRFVCLSDHYVITWQWTACTIAKICVRTRTSVNAVARLKLSEASDLSLLRHSMLFSAHTLKYYVYTTGKLKKQILNFLGAEYVYVTSWLKTFLKKYYLPETVRNIPGIRGVRRSNPMTCYTT